MICASFVDSYIIIISLSLTIYYTETCWIVNPYRTQNRNFLYIHPIEEVISYPETFGTTYPIVISGSAK